MNKQPRLPISSVFNPDFRYRNSLDTDVRITFKRIRRELAAAAEADVNLPENVTALPVRKETPTAA
jgi:hypothetical protein